MYLLQAYLFLGIIPATMCHIHKMTEDVYSITEDQENKENNNHYLLVNEEKTADLVITRSRTSETQKIQRLLKKSKNAKSKETKPKNKKKKGNKSGKGTLSPSNSSSARPSSLPSGQPSSYPTLSPLLKYATDVVGLCAIDQSCDTDTSNRAVNWFIIDENHPKDTNWDVQVWKERLVLAILCYSMDCEDRIKNGWLSSKDHTLWPNIYISKSTHYVYYINLNWGSTTTIDTIPTEIGLLTALEYVYLGYNSGPIPTEIMHLPSLHSLFLSQDALSTDPISTYPIPTYPIPTEIGLLTSLANLGIQNSYLSGPIPIELWQLTSLENIYVISNSALSGMIPTEIGQLTSLVSFELEGNAISGPIPTQIGQLSNLEYACLLANNALTGTIPTEFGQLSLLYDLTLDHNALTGTIPTELGQMTSARWILSHNALTGTIPTEILSRDLYLNDNALTGTIPTELFQLLQEGDYFGSILLSNNDLTGTIPTEFERTPGTSLLLDGNAFTGTIPSNFKYAWGQSMYFHGNNLTGSIPDKLCDRVIGDEVTWFVADVDNCVLSKPGCCPPCTDYCPDTSNRQNGGCLPCVTAQELHGFPSQLPTISSAPSSSENLR